MSDDPLRRKREEVTRHAMSMCDHVRDLYARGQNREALQLAGLVPDVVRTYFGANHSLYADALELVGMCRHALDQEAESLFRQVLDVRRGSGDRLRVATALVNLGGVLSDAARYADAEVLFGEAVELRRSELGADDAAYAVAAHGLAEVYRLTGRQAEAAPLFEQVERVFEGELGSDHPNRIACLSNYASSLLAAGDPIRATELLRKTATLAHGRFGSDHPATAAIRVNLAAALIGSGDLDEAERTYQEVIPQLESLVGESDPHHTKALVAFASLHQSRANYPAAEQLCERALRIERAAGRATLSQYAGMLSTLSEVCRQNGNLARARELLQEAIDVRRRTVGTGHADYAAALHNLARHLWYDCQLFDQAERLYRESLLILAATVGTSSSMYATGLDNLAELYRATRRYTEAEPLYRQVLAIREAAPVPNPAAVASVCNNLGCLYDDLGRHAEAEQYYRESLDVRVAVLGETHPLTVITVQNLACVLAARGESSAALDLLRRAARSDDSTIGLVFSASSERQKLEFMSSLAGKLDGYLSLVLDRFPESPAVVRDALELVFRRKGLVEEAIAAQQDVVEALPPELAGKVSELRQLRMRIAEMALAGPTHGPVRHDLQLAELTRGAEGLEAEIARARPDLLRGRLSALDLRAVAAALPNEAVLVEYVRFRPYHFAAVPTRGESRWGADRYVAFTLATDPPGDVRLIDLGEAEAIDGLVAGFRAAITGESEGETDRDMVKAKKPTTPADDAVGRALRAAVFDKLAPALRGRTRLVLAPDGDLSRLPFEVLPADGGRRVIDTYSISYIGCGRDLLRHHPMFPQWSGEAVVVADPDFDLSDDGRSPAVEPGDQAGRQSHDLREGQPSFDRLPGTRDEGVHIAELLKARPYLQAGVLKRRLKRIRSPWVLHLATHGFFLTDQDLGPDRAGRDDRAARGDMGRLSGLRLENPLLRSGLALAGGNTWLRKGRLPPEAEDGLLTAEDVTGMDLLGTELVVLSACDTGLGVVRTGEGVFGLRRAFALAGARTLVMSLWKVPDGETRELMEDFYRRVLAGEPRAEALRGAQLAMKARYPHPFFWGAFICQGSPGPLPARRRCYYSPDGKESHGPVSDAELKDLIGTGKLTQSGRVSLDGKTWREAYHLKGITWPSSTT
ncbi:CHAT domain-containing tetratricopeptide repeat protein [Urbifossiella limnaea]|uniref:CHAT domain protein n=1 Tax=Urbifossiella limnaea TaxID=2528023 RepID=A0A517XW73_9BACT|nr:CHAT domain-containing protein [Urbifossiella limnaea]QDU21756.1 CHAT domain protein [Urbifossiella limnaea]